MARTSSPSGSPTRKPPPAAAEEPMRWAGHGHVGGFLLQLGILIGVNLALWGVVFLMALKFSGVIGAPDTGQ